MKNHGVDTLEGQVRRELKFRDLPYEVQDVEVLAALPESITFFRSFVVSRSRGPLPPEPSGFKVGLRFVEAVKGPLSIGYGSHLGLGLFETEP